jgi:predicted ATPase with chaperone activity
LKIRENAIDKLGLSARAHKGVLRITRTARTVANPANSEDITSEHVMESIQYRIWTGGKSGRLVLQILSKEKREKTILNPVNS